jgi:Leucine-rich repeat (LRR) protein
MPVLAFLVFLGALPWIIAAVPANPDDAAAMQSIFNTTGAAKSLGWGVKSADPCGGAWAGVSCDNAGRVVSIRASRAGLAGWFHASDLSKLTLLTELDLGFNDLIGQTGGDLPLLPTPLQHLRALDIRSNRFLGVPEGFFAAFPALETINLDDNPMVGPRFRPADVLTCSGLRSFSANNISLSLFPDFLGSAAAFPALESLSLARNELHGAIAAGFGNGGKIKFLDVSSQSSLLTGRIDQIIAGMKNLVEVRLDHNAFFGPLPDATNLVNLRLFDAAGNNLRGVPNFAGTVSVDVSGNPRIGKPC